MIGLELAKDGKVIPAAVSRGNLLLCANIGFAENPNISQLEFRGVDYVKENRVTWYSIHELKIGDEFKVRITDVTENAIPLKVRPYVKRTDEEVLKIQLRQYEDLKKELEKLGLI